jgi:hypothetical protein
MKSLENHIPNTKLFIWPSKEVGRICEKVSWEYLSKWKWLEALTDYTRATLVFDSYWEFPKGINHLKNLVKEGKIKTFNVKNRINSWCADMLINIQTHDWYTSEIQFHTPESLIMKESYLWKKIIEEYAQRGISLKEIELSKSIFDLEANPFTNNEIKVLNKLNELRNKKLLLPQQWNIINMHDIYDINRILPQNINKFYEMFWFWEQFTYTDIQSLSMKLNKISDNLTKKSLENYYSRVP